MKLKPLFDKIVVKPIVAETKTASGIVLAGASDKEQSNIGKVIAVGNGFVLGSEIRPLLVSVGDTVIYSKYQSENIVLDGAEFVIIRQSDVLAIMENI